MGDPKANTEASAGHIIQALTNSLPDAMNAINAQLVPTAQAQLKAAQTVSPAYNQLLADLYAKYGTQAAQTGSNIEARSREAQAGADTNLYQRFGIPLAQAQRDSDAALNPEATAATALAGNKLSELLGSINLSNANPEAERLVNQEAQRSGNANVQSATGTVANALSFGDEMQKRRNALSAALTQATQFIPAATKQNAATGMLTRGTQGTGQSQFAGVANAPDQAYNTGNQLINALTGVRQQQLQLKQDSSGINKAGTILGSL